MLLEKIGTKYLEHLLFAKGISAFSIDNSMLIEMAFGASVIIILLTILTSIATLALLVILIQQHRTNKMLKELLKKLTDKDTRTEE